MKFLTILILSSFIYQKSDSSCRDYLISIDYLKDQIENLKDFRHVIIVPVKHVNSYQYLHVTEFLNDGYFFKGLAILFISSSKNQLIQEFEQYYLSSNSIFVDDREKYYENMCFSANPIYIKIDEKGEIVNEVELTIHKIYPVKSSLIRGLKRVNIRR